MKKLSKLTALLLAAVMALSLAACSNPGAENSKPPETKGSQGEPAGGKYTVGICQQDQHPALDAATQGFKDALVEKLGQDGVAFKEGNASGDTANCPTIINGFLSENVDLILANATGSLQAAHSATADIPILGTSVTDYATALEPELYDAMPSYVRVLQENGYHTTAFHAHTDALYNRDQNYPHLGFDQVLFYDPFLEGATFEGGFFDDDSAADVIISLFEENRSQPLFLYTMTMQNHQTYHAGRYPENRVEVSSPLLTAEELEGVTCYVNGLYDADRMLGKLVDYFSAVDEPVLLVFAGDHPPSLPLSQEETVYTRLGVAPSITSAQWSAEDYKNMMVTDYLIWSNYLDGEGQVPNSTMSMGATVLELSGVRNTPFFAWMNQIRRETMLFHARILTLDPSGQVVSGDEPAIRAFRTAYTDVIYDTLYGRHYLGGAVNRVRDP